MIFLFEIRFLDAIASLAFLFFRNQPTALSKKLAMMLSIRLSKTL